MTEDINTQDPEFRDKLLSMSNQAESESRRTSKRVKWGQRRQMEQGVVFGRKEMLGYNIVRDSKNNQVFQTIPEEAELVRRIYNMYKGGLGTFKIARLLESEGINSKRYVKDGAILSFFAFYEMRNM